MHAGLGPPHADPSYAAGASADGGAGRPTSPPPRSAPFKAFGFEFELPRWAIATLAVVVVAGVTVFVGLTLYVRFEPDLGATAHATEQTEYERHFIETQERPSEIFEHSFSDVAHGDLKVSYFKSDGCVLLLRRSETGPPSMHWVKDFSSDLRTPAPGRLFSSIAAAPLMSAGIAAPPASTATQACGRCVHPHKGQFQSWQGERKGCWVQMWRRWPEGCTHYQWFNSCSGYWDSEPNGSAKVHWTCCVH